jgi:hypothetical protein
MTPKKMREADALWGRPMTEAGADLLARRHGFRFVGLVDPMASPAMREATGIDEVAFAVPGVRYMAMFASEREDGRAVIFSDGRTLARALRRGLEMVRQVRGDAVMSRPMDAEPPHER